MAAAAVVSKTFAIFEEFLHNVADLDVFDTLIFNYKLKNDVIDEIITQFNRVLNEFVNHLQACQLSESKTVADTFPNLSKEEPTDKPIESPQAGPGKNEVDAHDEYDQSGLGLAICEEKEIDRVYIVPSDTASDIYRKWRAFVSSKSTNTNSTVSECDVELKENVKTKGTRRKKKDETTTKTDCEAKKDQSESTASKFFKCGVCNRKFFKETRLLAHLTKCNKLKSKMEMFMCDFCDLGFGTRRMLTLHIERIHKVQTDSVGNNHSSTEDFVCINGGELPREIPFLCCFLCQSVYKTPPEFVGHTCRQSASANGISEGGRHLAASLERLRTLRKFRCGLCKEEFRSMERMMYHLTRCTGGPYRCELCFQKYDFPKDLNQHKKKVHREANSHFCDECGLNFKLRTSLQKHKVNRHEKFQNLFTCEECSKTFTKRIHLTRHKICFHRLERKYLCQVCGKKFSTHSSLSAHLDSHSELKRFSCSFCNRKFRQKEKLKFHTRIHTGERPHLCQTCGKGFIRKSKLDEHIRRHLGEKRYQCTECSKCYSKSWDLKVHMRKRHSEGIEPVPKPSQVYINTDDDDPDDPVALSGINCEGNRFSPVTESVAVEKSAVHPVSLRNSLQETIGDSSSHGILMQLQAQTENSESLLVQLDTAQQVQGQSVVLDSGSSASDTDILVHLSSNQTTGVVDNGRESDSSRILVHLDPVQNHNVDGTPDTDSSRILVQIDSSQNHGLISEGGDANSSRILVQLNQNPTVVDSASDTNSSRILVHLDTPQNQSLVPAGNSNTILTLAEAIHLAPLVNEINSNGVPTQFIQLPVSGTESFGLQQVPISGHPGLVFTSTGFDVNSISY